MKKCPFCAEEIQEEALICRFCGKELNMKLKPEKIKSRKLGTAGILAIATAGIALFMPVILMSLFAPLAFIFASVEIAKGKKTIGLIAMILSIIELGVVLSTFQSCSKSLSSIGSGVSDTKKEKLNWSENIKLVEHSVDSSSYSDYETYKFQVKNIGNHTLKQVKFTLYKKDRESNTILTKSDTFLYSWNDPMKPGEFRKFDMYVDRIKGVAESDTFSYMFDIEDYE